MSESWRKTLPTTIDVTLICPGFVESEMTQKAKWKPFIIKTDIAAKKIVNALNKKKKMFIFPWQMRIVVAFKGLLGIVMTNAARKMHQKQTQKN